MPNLFLPIYRNLEKEVLQLSENIFFNDDQLNVYSTKIAELLIQTVVEIESLSKELYFKNGGHRKYNDDGKEEPVFFDTDCIALLEQRWELSKKEVLIAAPNFYFQNSANKILTPLHKANKRGSSAPDWARAYQAVKHDRGNNLAKANIKVLIRALGALYILNIYNRTEQEIKRETISQDSSFGSQIFTAQKQIAFFPPSFLEDVEQYNDKSCICIERVPDHIYKKIIDATKEDLLKRRNFFQNSPEGKSFLQEHPELVNSKIDIASIPQFWTSKFLNECMCIGQKSAHLFFTSPKEIVLNKGQQIYPD